MAEDSMSRLSAEELSAVTGEPVERLQRLRSLQLIGSEGDEGFAPEDAERIRLIQFLERREIGLETIDFDLRQTLRSVVALLAERAQSKGILLRHSVSPEVPATLQGDPHRLRMA